jgi:hypothetical protein
VESLDLTRPISIKRQTLSCLSLLDPQVGGRVQYAQGSNDLLQEREAFVLPSMIKGYRQLLPRPLGTTRANPTLYSTPKADQSLATIASCILCYLATYLPYPSSSLHLISLSASSLYFQRRVSRLAQPALISIDQRYCLCCRLLLPLPTYLNAFSPISSTHWPLVLTTLA